MVGKDGMRNFFGIIQLHLSHHILEDLRAKIDVMKHAAGLGFNPRAVLRLVIRRHLPCVMEQSRHKIPIVRYCIFQTHDFANLKADLYDLARVLSQSTYVMMMR